MSRKKPPPSRSTVTVEIAGERHVLRSDVPPEYTRAVAAYLDETIRGLPSFPTLEPFRAATLAALSITDELFHAREEIAHLRAEIERRSVAAAAVLEEETRLQVTGDRLQPATATARGQGAGVRDEPPLESEEGR